MRTFLDSKECTGRLGGWGGVLLLLPHNLITMYYSGPTYLHFMTGGNIEIASIFRRKTTLFLELIGSLTSMLKLAATNMVMYTSELY